jgi:hypothetical protein
MHINTDLSTDNLALSLPQKRSEPSGASTPVTAETQSGSSASQLDPLLQRLTGAPSSIQNGQPEVQSESEAAQVMNALLQGMRGQPGMAMAAQGNPLSGNVLSLLQSTE